MDYKEIFTASMILFAVIDIIGATPIVISLREKVGKIQSEKATLVSMAIMIGFLFVGEEILNLIGIDINSFAVAGAIVIFDSSGGINSLNVILFLILEYV